MKTKGPTLGRLPSSRVGQVVRTPETPKGRSGFPGRPSLERESVLNSAALWSHLRIGFALGGGIPGGCDLGLRERKESMRIAHT